MAYFLINENGDLIKKISNKNIDAIKYYIDNLEEIEIINIKNHKLLDEFM